MAESFLFNIAESLIEKLTSSAYEEAFQAFNLNKDLDRLKGTLSIVKAVLLDAEAKHHQSQALGEWLRQIKDVFLDAQDVLDELECHAREKQVLQTHGSNMEKVCRFLSFSPLAFRFRVAHEIKEISERLDKVTTDGNKFGLERIEVNRDAIHRREMTDSEVTASDVIGRDHDKKNVIDLLFQTHTDGGLSVVPIVGLGGMGKTTLAKLVFNDKRIGEEFPLKMWVCVSDDFNIKQLMIKIINFVSSPSGQENITNLNEEQLQNHLKNRLARKKFLLVLDDVWNKNRVKWVKLQNVLRVGEGSRIIVTTRDKDIATMMGTIPFYELKGLSNEESLSIFIKWAFNPEEEKKYPNLVEIGKGIITKCKGVPLAVTTLASSLFRNFEEEEWKSLRDNEIWDLPPKEEEIWDLSQKEEKILPALKLSYDRMPFYLKQCFSFFSLYPKDFEFDSIYIAELWVALGLIHPSNESSKLEDVATQYLHELHSRCFLQDFLYSGYFYSFKMHDLVHDLAVFVTKDEFLMVNSHTKKIHKCRHLSIIENGGQENEMSVIVTHDRKRTNPVRRLFHGVKNLGILNLFPRFKCVKTIMFPVENVGLGMKSEDLLNKWFSRYNYLRLLDLSDSSFKILPKSIGNLRCLRHLNLSFNLKLEKLPNSICELQSLQTLLLQDCVGLRALPKGLRKLISLRQLAITTTDLSKIDISSLTSLQILSFHRCWYTNPLFGGIQQLTSLKELVIYGCHALNSFNLYSIIHLPELAALSIVGCPIMELSEGRDNLETTRMKLRFVRFEMLYGSVSLPGWLRRAGHTLHTLIIQDCSILQVLPDWLSTFSQLNTLRIKNCERLLSLPNNMKGFTALECLEIVDCRELERQYKYEVGKYWPNISHLKSITISGDWDLLFLTPLRPKSPHISKNVRAPVGPGSPTLLRHKSPHISKNMRI